MKELKEKQTDVCQHVSNKMPTQHSKMFKMLILKLESVSFVKL